MAREAGDSPSVPANPHPLQVLGSDSALQPVGMAFHTSFSTSSLRYMSRKKKKKKIVTLFLNTRPVQK